MMPSRPSIDRAFYRRLAVTAAALVAYRLGCDLPVPGLAPEAVTEVFRVGGAAVGRFSIFALGITPLLSVLILAEALKIVAPAVRRWENAAPRNRNRFQLAVLGLALVMAALQSAGIAGGLEDISGLVPEPATYFRIGCIATLVAGAALVIALAGLIDRAGLGSGLWLIFLAPTLAELPLNMATIAALFQQGQYPLAGIVSAALFTACAIAGVAGIVLAARGSETVASACIWPLLIAYAVLSWLLIGVGLAITGGKIDEAVFLISPGSPVRHLTLAGLVILIAWLHVRSNGLAGLPVAVPAAPIAVVLATIALAGEMLASPQLATALPLGSVYLVVVAVVATTMLLDWGLIAGGERRAEDKSESVSPRV
jgi:hypothetical protein